MMKSCSLAAAALLLPVLLLVVHGASAQPAPPAEVRVVFVRDGVYTSPTDAAWNKIPESTYALQAQLITAPNGGGERLQGLRSCYP